MSQGRVLRRLGRYLRARQPWMLVALLLVLHLTLLAGAGTPAGLMFWLVDVGLFILWQPFVQTERRLNVGNLLLIAVALAVGCWLFSWWLLIVWTTILASLLGGRVMLLGEKTSTNRTYQAPRKRKTDARAVRADWSARRLTKAAAARRMDQGKKRGIRPNVY